MESGLLRSIGLCRCCLEFTITKNLWLEYKWKDTFEIYADMIQECFKITPWSNDDNAEDERICETCVGKLRGAWEFKRQVTENYNKLLNHPAKEDMVKRKTVSGNKSDAIIERDNEIREVEDEEYDVQNFIGEYELLADTEEPVIAKEDIPCDKPLVKSEKVKYQNVRLKRQPTVNRRVTRKVISGRKKMVFPKPAMSLHTIHTNKGNQCQILDNSTILPFKTKHGFFVCFYCPEVCIVHEELKTHNETCHANVSIAQYATDNLFYWPKDKIYADITNIVCKICKVRKGSVAELVTHLTEVHEKKFNHRLSVKPEDSILGFMFYEDKTQCSLCAKEFSMFRHVLKHMNEHYSDYICDICGKSFFLLNRLRLHYRLHNNTPKRCKICGLEFKNELKLKDHCKRLHKKFSYSCAKCRIPFASKRLQTIHLAEVHKRPMPVYKCGVCERDFQSKEGLRLHKKKSRCD